MKSYMEKNWQGWIEKTGIKCVYVYSFKWYTSEKLTECDIWAEIWRLGESQADMSMDKQV